MERGSIVHCCQCHEAIISGEGFACFKVPGQKSYQFFHRRFPVGDCWEGHLRQRKQNFGECRDFRNGRFARSAGTNSEQFANDFDFGLASRVPIAGKN